MPDDARARLVLAVWAEATLGRAALRAAVWAALLVGAPRLAPNQRPRWRAALRAVLARLDDTEPAGGEQRLDKAGGARPHGRRAAGPGHVGCPALQTNGLTDPVPQQRQSQSEGTMTKKEKKHKQLGRAAAVETDNHS